MMSLALQQFVKQYMLLPLRKSSSSWVIREHYSWEIASSHSINLPLTYRQLETHAYILSTVVTDVLVLKHQAISIHSAEIFIVFDQFYTRILQS